MERGSEQGNHRQKKGRVSKHKGKCSTLVSQWGMRVDAMVRCHCTPSDEHTSAILTVSRGIKDMAQLLHLPDSSWAKSVKSKMSTTFNLTWSCRKCTPIGGDRVHSSTLSNCKNDQQPSCSPRRDRMSKLCSKCPSTDERIKIWYIYTIEYSVQFSSIAQNKILPFVATRMDLEGIMLSQRKTNTLWLSLTHGI